MSFSPRSPCVALIFSVLCGTVGRQVDNRRIDSKSVCGLNRTRVRIPSSPPILTKYTFETIGFERVFCCICTSGPRFFRDFPRFFSIPPKSRKRLLHKAFWASKNSCKRHFSVLFCPVFVFFECFLRVFNLFSAFLRCPTHFLCRQIRAASRLFPSLPASRFCHPN